MSRNLLTLFLLYSFTCLLGAQVVEDPNQILQRALKHHRAGRYESAINEYERLIEFGAVPPDLYTNLGAAHASAGNFQKAIEYYERAVKAGGNSQALSLNLGLTYFKVGDLQNAIDEFLGVLRVEPTNEKAATLLADSYFRLGAYTEVIEVLMPFEKNVETNPAIAYLLGTALVRRDRVEEGQKFVDVVLRNGDSAEAHLLLASGYRSARDLDSALREVRKAIELNPELPKSHALLGELLLAVSGIDQVERNPALMGEVRLPDDLLRPAQAFRKELAVNPSSFEAHFYLGFILKTLGEYPECVEHLTRAIKLRPQALQVRYHLGHAYLLKGDLRAARDTLESLVDEIPTLREAHSLLASTYYRLDNKKEAVRHQEEVVELTIKADEAQKETDKPSW